MFVIGGRKTADSSNHLAQVPGGNCEVLVLQLVGGRDWNRRVRAVFIVTCQRPSKGHSSAQEVGPQSEHRDSRGTDCSHHHRPHCVAGAPSPRTQNERWNSKMTGELVLQVVFYCVVMLLFPLGAMITTGLERFIVVSSLFMYPLWLAIELQLESNQFLVVVLVVPGTMLALGRFLYGVITAREKGKKGSTPARQ